MLTLGEATCRDIDNAIREITRRAKADGAVHNFTVSIRETGEGISLHCNPGSLNEAAAKLAAHCHLRKYTEKAQKWFGLCLDMDESIRTSVVLDFPWQQSDQMDAQTDGMRRRTGTSFNMPAVKWASGKVGRNAPCPCGSGLKYKKCHLGNPV